MRLATIRGASGPAVGVVTPDGVFDLNAAWPSLAMGSLSPPGTVLDLVAHDGMLARLEGRLGSGPGSAVREHIRALAEVRLEAPVANPGKVICVASNYAAHIKESGREVPPDRHIVTPWLFLKPPTTLVGPGAPIRLPRAGQAIDWEVELAAVIGRRGKYVPIERALEYVAGYTIVNDVSERRFKVPAARPPREWDKFFDWLHGKWFDGFGPMGPWLVTADEIPDPQALTLELRVNGRVRQQGHTSQMIYSVAELIAFASSVMTLLPGDVIATGTPQGVGSAAGEFLQPGDVVECRVEGIGALVNPVIAEDDGVGARS